jgi:hypothetical protein
MNRMAKSFVLNFATPIPFDFTHNLRTGGLTKTNLWTDNAGWPLGKTCADGTSEMRTLLYIFAICLAALILFVTVDRVESGRPLATLLMILILGIVAAAVLIKVMP